MICWLQVSVSLISFDWLWSVYCIKYHCFPEFLLSRVCICVCFFDQESKFLKYSNFKLLFNVQFSDEDLVIISPEKQKTLVILSGIMNFLHFRKQRMEVVLEKQAKFVCFVAAYGELYGMGSKVTVLSDQSLTYQIIIIIML